MENSDILDILLNEDNNDPIVFTNDKGESLSFNRIASFYYNDKLYAILKPLDKIDGIQEDEAVVFYVNESEDGKSAVLEVESDELTAIAVFDEYYNLIEKSRINNKD